MNKIFKENRVYIITAILCLLLMLVIVIADTNIFYIVGNFITNAEYRENYGLAESTIKKDYNILQVIEEVFGKYLWEFDVMMIFGLNFIQILFPCLIVIAGFKFYKKYTTIFKFAMYRYKNYKSFIIKNINKEALKISFSLFSAFLSFFVFSMIVSKGNCMGASRTLFVDILGKSYVTNHMYTYYLLDGVVRFFLMPYVYAFFSCCVAIIAQNIKQVIFAPIIYYLGLSSVGYASQIALGKKFLYLTPSTIMSSGAYDGFNSSILILTSSIPLFIGIFILWRKFKNGEV